MDPIRDSWEARIRSMRMSSKNLFGENAEKCKKVSKNHYTKAVQFRAQNNQDSNCVLAKKGGSSEEFCVFFLNSLNRFKNTVFIE